MMARSKRSLRSSGSACSRRFGVRRHHAPLGGLQRQDAPVGGVVVHHQQALALEWRLFSDEVALAPVLRLRQRSRPRQDGEVEGAAAARPGAFHPHAAAHQFGQQLADGQAEARAAVLARGAAVGLAELLEQAALALFGQADAGVAHRKVQQRATLALFGHHAQHHLTGFGELDRVAEQVQQDLAQPCDVAIDHGRHFERAVALEQIGDVEVLLGGATGDQVERRFDAVAQVEGVALDVHAPGLDLREVEDVVDDRQQRIAAVADGAGEVALLVVQRCVQQQPAHADDGVHRRADLVAHCRQEGALGFVGRFGLGAGFVDPP